VNKITLVVPAMKGTVKVGWNSFFLNIIWCAPFGYLYFLSFQLLNEPGLGVGIDPGMALTPFPSSIG
jgi:hypothetical protein